MFIPLKIGKFHVQNISICKNYAQLLIVLKYEEGIEKEETSSLISNYRQTGLKAERRKICRRCFFS
jgi:hypothetical protein